MCPDNLINRGSCGSNGLCFSWSAKKMGWNVLPRRTTLEFPFLCPNWTCWQPRISQLVPWRIGAWWSTARPLSGLRSRLPIYIYILYYIYIILYIIYIILYIYICCQLLPYIAIIFCLEREVQMLLMIPVVFMMNSITWAILGHMPLPSHRPRWTCFAMRPLWELQGRFELPPWSRTNCHICGALPQGFAGLCGDVISLEFIG